MALKGKLEHSHFLVKCVLWIGCILLLLIPATVVCVSLLSQQQSTEILKWVQFIQTAATFLLPPLMVAYLCSNQPRQWLQLRGTSAKNASWAILLMLLAIPAINLLAYINQQMTLPAFLQPLEEWMKIQEENAAAMTEQLLNVSTIGGLIINLLLMAVLPALAEELTFRGVLMRLFQPMKSTDTEAKIPHMAIWCSAILFSAIHMQFYGFLPRMLMGALFGYMLVWTGSLWVPMLMHFVNNAMAVVLYFLCKKYAWDIAQWETIGTNNTLWLGVVSMVVVGLGIYAFRRSTTMSNASSRMSNGN